MRIFDSNIHRHHIDDAKSVSIYVCYGEISKFQQILILTQMHQILLQTVLFISMAKIKKSTKANSSSKRSYQKSSEFEAEMQNVHYFSLRVTNEKKQSKLRRYFSRQSFKKDIKIKTSIAIIVKALVSAYRLNLMVYLHSLQIILKLNFDRDLQTQPIHQIACAVFYVSSRILGKGNLIDPSSFFVQFNNLSESELSLWYRTAVIKATGINILYIYREDNRRAIIAEVQQKMRKNAQAADKQTKLAKQKEDHYENDNTQTAETSMLHKRFF